MADTAPDDRLREHARGLLLAYASSGVPISASLRNKLWHSADPDDEFRRALDATHRARESRERRHADDLAELGRKMRELEEEVGGEGGDPA